MTDTEKCADTKRFAANCGRWGDEKLETQRFWVELQTKVSGMDGSNAIRGLSINDMTESKYVAERMKLYQKTLRRLGPNHKDEIGRAM